MSVPPITLERLFAAEGSVRLERGGFWGEYSASVGRLHRGRFANHVGGGPSCSVVLADLLGTPLPAEWAERIDDAMQTFTEVDLVGVHHRGDHFALVGECYVDGGKHGHGVRAARVTLPARESDPFYVGSLVVSVRYYATLVRTRGGSP